MKSVRKTNFPQYEEMIDYILDRHIYFLFLFFHLLFETQKNLSKWFIFWFYFQTHTTTRVIYISINVFLFSIFTCCRVSLISNKKPDREVIQSFTQPTFRITNLKPNTTYNIAISANNSHGRSRPHELVAQTDEGIFNQIYRLFTVTEDCVILYVIYFFFHFILSYLNINQRMWQRWVSTIGLVITYLQPRQRTKRKYWTKVQTRNPILQKSMLTTNIRTQ